MLVVNAKTKRNLSQWFVPRTARNFPKWGGAASPVINKLKLYQLVSPIMQSNEDYMDEDGPEFIAMINDMVRHVRSETMAHPSSHLPDRKDAAFSGSTIDIPN
jgi:hypothetical protein